MTAVSSRPGRPITAGELAEIDSLLAREQEGAELTAKLTSQLGSFEGLGIPHARDAALYRRARELLSTLTAAPRIHGVTWVLIRDGFVLLERCEKKARVLGVGEWFVPGGKIEGDEIPEDALRREIGEEWPGVELLTAQPLPILEGSAVPPGPRGLFLMRPYLVTVSFARCADGTAPDESSEGTPLRWTPISEALASPVVQVRMMVAAAMDARVGATRGHE